MIESVSVLVFCFDVVSCENVVLVLLKAGYLK